jgi:hypothetical protein
VGAHPRVFYWRAHCAVWPVVTEPLPKKREQRGDVGNNLHVRAEPKKHQRESEAAIKATQMGAHMQCAVLAEIPATRPSPDAPPHSVTSSALATTTHSGVERQPRGRRHGGRRANRQQHRALALAAARTVTTSKAAPATRGAPDHGRSDAIKAAALGRAALAESALESESEEHKAGPWEFTPSHLCDFDGLCDAARLRLRRRLRQPARRLARLRIGGGGGGGAPPSPPPRGWCADVLALLLAVYKPPPPKRRREKSIGCTPWLSHRFVLACINRALLQPVTPPLVPCSAVAATTPRSGASRPPRTRSRRRGRRAKPTNMGAPRAAALAQLIC